MKTKYVFRGLIGLFLNFHNNRTMWSTNLHEKICRWGEWKKSPKFNVGLIKNRKRFGASKLQNNRFLKIFM